jgi:AcrR family transcriptional regulator
MSDAIWDRPEPAGRPTPSPLSRELIVRAAIALADADGLEAVSVRRVASALGAGPMRLYGYLSTKDDLLDLMVDEVYGEITAPGDGDWRQVTGDLARATRAAALRHEWFTDLLGERFRFGPHALAHLEARLAALALAPGLTSADAVFEAGRTVGAYVIGALRLEIAERRAARVSGRTKREWQAAAGPHLSSLLATGRYPTVARVVGEAGTRDPAAAFDAGLEQVLRGLPSAE